MMFAAILASALSMLTLPPRYGEPTRMHVYAVSNSADIATAYMPDDTTSNITVIAWVRWNRLGHTKWDVPVVEFLVTSEAARATREGGAPIQNLCAHDYETALTLNAGTWSAANVLPATYDLPTEMQDMQQWQYGCYCYNVTTDSDLTLNVGGAEVSIYAQPGVRQVNNILAATASRAVSIAAASESANIKFGIAENPLVQFLGSVQFGSVHLADGDTVQEIFEANRASGGISDIEWRMVVARVSIADGVMHFSFEGHNAMGLIKRDTRDQAMWRPRATFAKDARIRLVVFNAAGGMSDIPNSQGGEREIVAVYGFRIYRELLDDALIARMRELDYAELTRRGWL